jgi:hypothetical protein
MKSAVRATFSSGTWGPPWLVLTSSGRPYFHQDVAPSTAEQEIGCCVDRPQNCCLVAQALVLPLVEVADEHDHPAYIGGLDDAPQPVGVCLAQCAVDLDQRLAWHGLVLLFGVRPAS